MMCINDTVLTHLQELHFAFPMRVQTLALVMGEKVHPADFAFVVHLIYQLFVCEQDWTPPEKMSKGARDLFIDVCLAYIPFQENTIRQLHELEPKYLLLVLRVPYVKSPDHLYPERYAEVIAKEVDKFHKYQTLMAENDKYVVQSRIEKNYVEIAEEGIALYIEAKNSFESAMKRMNGGGE